MQRQPNKTKSKPSKTNKPTRRNGPPKRKTQTQTMAPVNISTRRTGGRPVIRSGNRATTISHTEYVADISSPGGNFNAISFSINPGLDRTFPWLGQIAEGYESYLFKSLSFSYRPICPTSTPGVVSIGVDYDARDSSPASKVQLNSYEGTVSCSVWDRITHVCSAANLKKFGIQRYTRISVPPGQTDIKTYDVGNLFVATSNTPEGNTMCGEIWVTYTVDLFTPQLKSTAVVNLNRRAESLSTPSQASIITTAAGVLSLAGEFMNAPLFAITQAFNDGVSSFFDVAFNPLVHGKDLFVLFKQIAPIGSDVGFRVGRPPNVITGNAGSLVTSWATEDGLWDWRQPSSAAQYARQFFTTIRPLADNPNVNINIPQYRFQQPINAKTQIIAMLAGSPPYPTVNSTGLVNLSPTVNSLKVDPTPWSRFSIAPVGARSEGQASNRATIKQESFEFTQEGKYNVQRMITEFNEGPFVDYDEIIKEYDQFTLDDTNSIASNVSKKFINRTL